MSDFVSLERSIQRCTLLAAGICGVLLTVSIGSVSFTFHVLWSARQAAARAPVLVVPGAVGGIYTPGINEESVRGVARYLAGIGTNFSGIASLDQRFDELETFASIAYLPLLQLARRKLRHEVEIQGQARAFFGSTRHEDLHQSSPGHFVYTVQGQRFVYASGLPMDARDSIVKLELALETPSRKNPLGIALERFEVADLPASSIASASPPAPGSAP